jgi:hypothetical protein
MGGKRVKRKCAGFRGSKGPLRLHHLGPRGGKGWPAAHHFRGKEGPPGNACWHGTSQGHSKERREHARWEGRSVNERARSEGEDKARQLTSLVVSARPKKGTSGHARVGGCYRLDLGVSLGERCSIE